MKSEFEELWNCPNCRGEIVLSQSFDVDCQSTTALIECSECNYKFGPMYPNTKQDVIEWIQEWNRQARADDRDALEDVYREDPDYC
jgi:transcription elongation factor Elf1